MSLIKLEVVRNICREYLHSQVIVAYSGGIDSSLVAKIAYDCLGDRALAVTAQSPSLSELEGRLALEHIQEIGMKHRFIHTQELDNPNYFHNSPDRCYFCKKELHTHLQRIAQTFPDAIVMDGVNADDLQDYRPGIRAAQEYRVRSPLAEANISKSVVRQLAQHLGISWWDKPAQPCLSSRFAYGEIITKPKLDRVAVAEAYLRLQGWQGNLRVRSFGDSAKIEVDQHLIDQFCQQFRLTELTATFQSYGFVEVIIDREGFRSGKLNQALRSIGRS